MITKSAAAASWPGGYLVASRWRRLFHRLYAGHKKGTPARPQPIESNDLTARQKGVSPRGTTARPAARRCGLGKDGVRRSVSNVAAPFWDLNLKKRPRRTISSGRPHVI